MGHQVRFFASPADTADLQARLAAVEPLLILHSRSSDGRPRTVPSLNLEDEERRWLFYYLVRAEDVTDVVLAHVPLQSYWAVDVMRSPVVEVHTCYQDESVLRIGRLFYVDGYYDGESWVEKPTAFRRWAKRTLEVAKRGFERRGADYVGPAAATWLSSRTGRAFESGIARSSVRDRHAGHEDRGED